MAVATLDRSTITPYKGWEGRPPVGYAFKLSGEVGYAIFRRGLDTPKVERVEANFYALVDELKKEGIFNDLKLKEEKMRAEAQKKDDIIAFIDAKNVVGAEEQRIYKKLMELARI